MIDLKSTNRYGLPAEAKPEHVARRDSFWSGVVLYREKRWGVKPMPNFKRHAAPEGEDEFLLCNSICARLEPLVLQLTESSLEEKADRALRRTEYPVAIRI